MASRRQSLKALAKSRGYELDITKSSSWWFLDTVAPGSFPGSGPICVCASRRAAEAGLRACLESMPLKRKGRR